MSQAGASGRKFHNKYQQLKFTSIKLGLGKGRSAAVCNICKATLKNTSISRLEIHRNRCIPASNSDSQSENSSCEYSDDSTHDHKSSKAPQTRLKTAKVSQSYAANTDTVSATYNSDSGKRLFEGEPILRMDVTDVSDVTEEILVDDVEICNIDEVDIDNVKIIDEATLQNIDISAATSCASDSEMIAYENDHSMYCTSVGQYLEVGNNNLSKRNEKMADIFKTKAVASTASLSTLPSISSSSSKSNLFDNIEEKIDADKRTPRKSKSRRVLNSFIDSMSSEAKEKADVALAKFFYGCNIPFAVVESDNFKNFIKTIRPSYNLPCRKTLSSTLLDKVTAELMDSNSNSIGKTSCLLIDGWKNSSNNTKNVVTMLQTAGSSGGHNLFLDSCDLSTEKETGEALANICSQSMEIAKSQYKCEVYAVVSDNAANMMKMGRLTTLWHSTCSSHTGNLLAKDILDMDTIRKLNMVLKEFKRTDLENLLKVGGGYKIVLPAETRWCSHRDACQNFIKNLPIMKKVCALENIKVKAEITLHLYDEIFLEKVQETIRLLNPICELINKCQSSNFSIADSTQEWIIIKTKLNNEAVEIQAAVERRFHMAVNVYGMTANFLHPLYHGEQLENIQRDFIQDFLIENLDSNGLDGLNAYTNKRDIFLKLFDKKIESADTFWGLAERKFPLLSSLALKLLKIPASSAQLERIFSNWSFVHSPLRNRLNVERSKKLISVYYSLKFQDTNRSDDY